MLIPSNLRTAAEDSFDRATFKQLEVGSFPATVVKRLQDELPDPFGKLFLRIKGLLDTSLTRVPFSDWASYLLACRQNSYSLESWGKCLHQVGLIPDSLLVKNPDILEQRLHQNFMAVECLTDERQPLVSRIAALQIEGNNIQKPLFDLLSSQAQAEDVRGWGRMIAEDNNWQKLDLENWKFLDLRPPQELELFVQPLRGKQIVPRQPGDTNKRIITKENRDAKVTIGFSTKPGPMEVNSLTHFRIQIMRTADQGVIEYVSTLLKFKKSPGKTASRSKQIALSPAELAEGTYFFRVLALDEAGVVLNQKDAFQDPHLQEEWENCIKELGEENASRDDLHGRLTCDSEDFTFEVEKTDPEDPPETPAETLGKRQKAASLFQALFKMHQDYLKAKQYKDIKNIKIEEAFWVDQGKGKGKGKESSVEVRFNDVRHQYFIPVATALRELSLQILRAPDKLGTFRMDFSSTGEIHSGKAHFRDNQLAQSAPASFLAARQRVFQGILQSVQDENGQGLGIVETCDFMGMANEIEIYIAAFDQWMDSLLAEAVANLDENLLDTIRKLQLLDHAELIVPSPAGYRQHVFVLTPLHPLKLAWFLQLQRTCMDWEEKSIAESNPIALWAKEVQSLFLGDLYPTNHPLVLHGANLRSYYYAGELSPGWAGYLPVRFGNAAGDEKTIDRGLFGQIQNLLGIPNSLRDLVGFSPASLYRQIRRFLIQHPYVEVLHINVFNPGDGRKLVECLKQLQREPSFANLRYEIRLFASEDRLKTAGSAFDDFLNPSRNVSEEADVFTVPSDNALFPKIRFSRSTIADYQKSPEEYSAHLSVMIEVLPVDVRLERISESGQPSIFCFGLVVRPANSVLASDQGVQGWSHCLRLNDPVPISDEDSFTKILVDALGKNQSLVAVALAGRWTEDSPALSLFINDTQRTLLYQIHKYSDWVITIDENMGVEFFDAPGDEDCIPYLLDYSPGSGIEKAPLFVTTRPASEIMGLFLSLLTKLGLLRHEDTSSIFRFLEILRSVSGVVIMQSISSPNKALETVGLGLSRMLLERLSILHDYFIIPLDPHQDLFEAAKAGSDDQTTAERADLLIVSCDKDLEIINLQVVEVKCRQQISDGEALNSLKAKMTDQMDKTISCLQYHYDPSLRIPDRLDRPLKDQQLCEFLWFYLDRGKRYHLIGEETFLSSLGFLASLHGRHKLIFNRIGLIFEFEGDYEGVIQSQEAEDLVFIRVGRKVIDDLFSF